MQPKMTLAEFLKALSDAAKPGDFEFFKMLGHHGKMSEMVRHAETSECPVCWMASRLGHNPNGAKEHWPIGKRFMEDAGSVADAADDPGHKMRHELLAACKLV